MSFDTIPILDLSLAKDPATKPEFLNELRHALLEVGFFYLKNVGIPEELTQAVMREGIAFFDLPEEEKLSIEMKNAPSFLGYSRLSAEITAHALDHREQIDLSTDHPLPSPSAPLYQNLFSPTQWPSSAHLPNFKSTYTDYITRMGIISQSFTQLIAEAIGLPPSAFDKYVGGTQCHKLKIVKYPDLQDLGIEGQGQGVGPHKDSMFTSFLLQVTPHRGLQAQNLEGEWVDCPPVPGTLVVAIGQGMEALTKGVCRSTSHRVLSPASGSGARFSVPFFQGVSLDAEFEELESVGIGEISGDVRERRVVKGGVEFTFGGGLGCRTLGEATLRNRVKSHPDVGERWYPEILRGIREVEERERVAGKRAGK